MPSTLSWSYVVSEQKRLAEIALKDEENRKLILLALAAGVVSSLALGKLYTKLTDDEGDDDLRSLAGTGLIAVGAGVLSVFWKLNQAQFRFPSMQEALSPVTDISSDMQESLEDAGIYREDE